MKYIVTALMIVICLCPLQAMRKALVIGNANYAEGILHNSINDATDIAATLKDLGFTVSLHKDLNREGFYKAVGDFVSALVSSDEAVFFYSGHAAQIEGTNYLIPINEHIDSATRCAYLSYNTSMLLEELSRAAVSIVILDACRDNPFEFSRSLRSGLAPMKAAAGSQYVIFATEEGKTAVEGENRNSPFTESLLANMRTPGLKITDFVQIVSNEVAIKTRERQIPYSTGILRQDFYFAKAEPITPAPRISDNLPVEAKTFTPHGVGSIIVKTSLGGDIYLDGNFIQSLFAGNQATWTDIPVGIHEIKLVNPRESVIRNLKVEYNQTAVLDFDTKEIAKDKIEEKPVLGSINTNSLSPEPHFVKEPPLPIVNNATNGTGTLIITAAYECDVYLGGQFIGKVEAGQKCKFAKENAGVYTLELMHRSLFCRREIKIHNKETLNLILTTSDYIPYPDALLYVSGGTFQMGTYFINRSSEEHPRHEVQLSPFLMSRTEVEQKLWTEVMGYNHSEIKGGNFPVTNVSFYEALEFCNELSVRNGLTPCYIIDKKLLDPNNLCVLDTLHYTVVCNWKANGYRLPTEAEWEYVSRCGDSYNKVQFSGSNNISKVSWYSDNSEDRIQEVATKEPNEWGFYDLSGNVLEWCWDYFDAYNKQKQVNPKGSEKGIYHIARGGSFYRLADASTCTARFGFASHHKSNELGFRIVRNVH